MAVSMYNISFKETFKLKTLCTIELEEKDISQLKHAIEDLYYFEFIYGKSSRVCVYFVATVRYLIFR